jgi:hypothetical protein
MKISVIHPIMCSMVIGIMTLSSPAFAQKTVKQCETEWRANKAANQAKGITEKAYVTQCRAAASAEKPKAAPAAAKEKASTAKEKKSTAKEKASDKMAAPAGEKKKTVKECESEWRANKAANQAKGITEKAYVAECRAGTAMKSTAAPTQMKMAPPTETAKPAARTGSPGMGKPGGANQYAAEGAAKAHCPTGLVVWANLDSKIYHFSGNADYGHTKQGAYMCEKDAMGQGMRAAKNEKHP